MQTIGARPVCSPRRDRFATDRTALLSRCPSDRTYPPSKRNSNGPIGFLNHIVSGIISVSATDLFGVEIPWRTRRRMFRYKVHYWRWFGSIKQAVAAADELNLAYALRQRQIVKSRETNPITHERQAVPKHEGKLGFLRIAQVPDS